MYSLQEQKDLKSKHKLFLESPSHNLYSELYQIDEIEHSKGVSSPTKLVFDKDGLTTLIRLSEEFIGVAEHAIKAANAPITLRTWGAFYQGKQIVITDGYFLWGQMIDLTDFWDAFDNILMSCKKPKKPRKTKTAVDKPKTTENNS